MNEYLNLFTRASKLMRAQADEAMSRHGVRVGQNLVLEVLWEQDGLTPGELAERLSVATPTVVKSASRMETSGLLERRGDESDGRLVRLWLTPRARSIRGAIEAERDRLADRALAGLSVDERTVLLDALRGIVDGLSTSAKPSGGGETFVADFEPAREPEDLARLFLERANARDVEAVVALYEPDAVLVGSTLAERAVGTAAIRAFYRSLLTAGPTFTGDVRPAIRVGGLALTSTRFERSSLDADGHTVTVRTATAELARRQPDGTWRWLIDQPDVLAR